MQPKAVVLVSGGLDSTTLLALAKQAGFQLFALSVDYGQRHRVELLAAAKQAELLGAVEHKVVRLDLRLFGGSALTADIAVPTDRSIEQMNAGVPITYVPARNTILLGLALSYAESIGAFDIFFGPNALDQAGYPDCRPEYVRAFEALANTATKAGTTGAGTFRIHTPLVTMTKAEIIRTGSKLGVDYRLTSSCYAPDAEGRACGRCDACILRRQGFAEAGLADPTIYQPGVC